jgi:hypothetical protein
MRMGPSWNNFPSFGTLHLGPTYHRGPFVFDYVALNYRRQDHQHFRLKNPSIFAFAVCPGADQGS